MRCLDRQELEDWGMSQAIAWADAVVFCRTPATYGVIRALTFARHCGKRVLADIDDMVFSTAFLPHTTPTAARSAELSIAGLSWMRRCSVGPWSRPMG